MDLFFNLVAGLGLFLFGMNFMSQGMQKAAGTKMRGLIDAMTKNKFIAVVFGAIFTAVIQSSGATTVMVVSFVNAGLMSLEQSVGIIFGANIGTTITAQLVSLKLTAIAPYILLIGSVMMVFFKKPEVKKIGEIVLGFGWLFLGIFLMTAAMDSLKEFPSVLDTLAKLSNPFLGILLGFVITAILQSSSVTVSIILMMAGQGLIGLPICLFFILGCNIGSCTPAVLASLSGNKDSKRAALIHVMFNVFGMIILGVILLLGMDAVLKLLYAVSGSSINRCVANADTLFKVFQTVIFFPVSNWFIKLANMIIPGDDKVDSEYHLQYIGMKKTFVPATAAVEAIHEINRMGNLAIDNLNHAIEAFFEEDEEKLAGVYEQEHLIDFLNDEITNYLVRLVQYELPTEDSERIGSLFHVVSDIERIGDHAENIADAATQRYRDNIQFSKKADRELLEMYTEVVDLLKKALAMFTTGNASALDEIISEENDIDHMERTLQKNHVKRMAKGKCSPVAGMMFTDLISGLERIGDHSTNIAYSILESDPDEDEETVS